MIDSHGDIILSRKRGGTLRSKADLCRNRTKEIRSKKMRDNERWLSELLSGIDEDYENLLIVVEGKRDESVLRVLGVKAPIIRTQSGSSRVKLIEEISKQAGKESNLLILTDFDKEGETISSTIKLFDTYSD